MAAGNEAEGTAASTNQNAAAAGAGDKPTQTGDAFSKEKALEVIAQVRADRQAGAKDSAPAKTTESAATETTDKKSAAASEEASAAAEAKGDEKNDQESERVFTAEETRKPGFFDRLSKDEWKALEKQHPAVVDMYRSAQGELTRRGQKLAERERAIKESTAKKETTTSAATTDEKDKDLEALGYTPDDVRKLLSSKVGQQIIADAVKSTVKEMGFDPDKSNAQAEGFDLALRACPELKDDVVWSAVQQLIESDPDELEALETSKSPREIMRILKAAGKTVVEQRNATTREKSERDAKKNEKETKNATQPNSKAANASRSPAPVTAPKGIPTRDELLGFVKDEKARKGYKELS